LHNKELMFCAPHGYCLGNQIKEDELGRLCGTCGWEGTYKCVCKGFCRRSLKERHHLKDLGIEWR